MMASFHRGIGQGRALVAGLATFFDLFFIEIHPSWVPGPLFDIVAAQGPRGAWWRWQKPNDRKVIAHEKSPY
jgi:hypothetical protein